jgi:hypothetical protein
MLDIKPEFHAHYHAARKSNSSQLPVETVRGTGNGWTKKVNGNVFIKAVADRTTLHLDGAGAMNINGSLTIGG